MRLVILKPDAVKQKLSGPIISSFESINESILLHVAELRWLKEQELTELYWEHHNKDFFEKLIIFMMSGPSLLCLFRDNFGTPDDFRNMQKSLRALYGTCGPANLIHCPDSARANQRERMLFFPQGV